MLNALKKLFGMKKAEAPAVEVPYKVEAEATPVVAQATEAMVASVAPEVESKPAKKTAAKKTAKPKAPRKPKAPKAAK
jgi:hypothetical protein